jgi:diadenylate cyclase
MAEKDKLSDYLKKVSPGTQLRAVIDDLVNSNMGGLIVFDNKEVRGIIEGGFKINCKFSTNKLFELCKMDGAVIVSPDLKKIIYANVMLVPESKIPSSETGTRHKSGERTAKQANTFVIIVSERKHKSTICLGQTKYFLKDSTKLLGEVSNNIQLLEKQRELFNESKEKLDILEMSNLVTIGDVCSLIQRSEMMLRISDLIKRYFTELGSLGSIMYLRYKEVLRGVSKTQDNVIRDYSMLKLKKAKTLLSSFNFDSLMDRDIMSRLLFGGSIEENIATKGYRFLSYLNLTDKEVSTIVDSLKTLDNIFNAKPSDLKPLVKNFNSEDLVEEIKYLRDQILSGKDIS